MNRLFLALLLMTAASLAGGCATCSTPYDDCGPVFQDGHCRNELIDGRVGSVFAPKPLEDDAEAAEDDKETDDVYYEDELYYEDE